MDYDARMGAAPARSADVLPVRPVERCGAVLTIEDARAAGLVVRSRFDPLFAGDFVESDDGYVALVVVVRKPNRGRRRVDTTAGRFYREQAVWAVGGRAIPPQTALTETTGPRVIATEFGYSVDLTSYRFVRTFLAFRDPWLAARLVLTSEQVKTPKPPSVIREGVRLMGREDTRRYMTDSLREQFEAEGVPLGWAAKRLKLIAEDEKMDPKVALDAVKTVLKSLAPPKESRVEVSATVQAIAALAGSMQDGNPQLPRPRQDLRLIPAVRAAIDEELEEEQEEAL